MRAHPMVHEFSALAECPLSWLLLAWRELHKGFWRKEVSKWKRTSCLTLRVFKEMNKVRFCSFLQGKKRWALPSKICTILKVGICCHFGCNFSNLFRISLIKYAMSRFKLTMRENGSFWIKRSVLFWYFLISRSATVPGRYRRFFGAASPM